LKNRISRPNIYYLHPLLAGPIASWGEHLDRSRTLGFDHVLLAPCFAPGEDGDIFLTADFDRLHPALGDQGAEDGLRQIVELCRKRDLVPMLDLALDRLAADAQIVARQPQWFSLPGFSLPGFDRPVESTASAGLTPWDPRRSPAASTTAACRFQPEPDGLAAWWQQQLLHWVSLGIGGFRCLHPHAVPAPIWRHLIASVKAQDSACCFAAWAIGLSAAEIASLETCGFDFAFSPIVPASSIVPAGKADGLQRERASANGITPIISFSEPPFGCRLATQYGDIDRLRRGYRQAILQSATDGAGWLLPMGAEMAHPKRMSPYRADAAAFAEYLRHPVADLTEIVIAANDLRRDHVGDGRGPIWQSLAPMGAPVRADLAVLETGDIDGATRRLRLINADLDHRHHVSPIRILARSGEALESLPQSSTSTSTSGLELDVGEIRFLEVRPSTPIKRKAGPIRQRVMAATKSARLCIEAIRPLIDEGRFAVKRVLGEEIQVEADIFSDGHDQIGAALLWRAADDVDWTEIPMQPQDNDRWQASFQPARIGRYLFTIEAWRDDFATFQSDLAKKQAAGRDLTLEFEEANIFLAPTAEEESSLTPPLTTLRLNFAAADDATKLSLLLSPDTKALLDGGRHRKFVTRYASPIAVDVDRRAAGFSSWYELFPRSQSNNPDRHGRFDDVIARLPAISAMGFDTLYFPPIHPIGRINRKGRNNALSANDGDPGSPYAIGSDEGGHDAIHPELGTLEDFRRFIQAAQQHGLELALDFAIQCAPDHPWLKQHPDWFSWRPDGSLKYAENPPKKYEDIVNVDFYAPAAIPDLWLAWRDVVLFWRREGIKAFRVDNPHTKPFPFWEWLIGDIRSTYPDTIFLSEAFTRPKVMYRLAKLGFTQSYTYFTWRNAKWELQSYLTELTAGPPKDFFRPHFFVNTPDINPIFLQTSGRPGFLIRAALATTLSGLWGMYSGFELCEFAAIPGREEYLDSEKYQLRVRDWTQPGNIIQEITQLNFLRRRHPALQTHLGLNFHNAFNDNIIYFSKATPERDDVILVAINLDPFHPQGADIEVPLWDWGMSDAGAVDVTDLITGHKFTWHGKNQHLHLDPNQLPYAIWHLQPAGGRA